MRKIAALFVGVFALTTLGFAGTLPKAVSPVPQSLDAFYPPKAKAPVHLFGMLKLDTAFSGIVVDLLEDDPAGAKGSFQEFKAQYSELSKLVPEWKKRYPMAPVEKLGALLGTADRGTVMAAYGEVGKVCHECHVATMVPVQQKYHWGDFGAIRVKDPLTQETVDFSLFKKVLSANFAGISVDLRQGQTGNAVKQLQGFRARFQALKETCQNCHDAESRYYVDESMEAQLQKLEQALASQNVSPEAVGALVQGIGRESCSKCHLVHVPAALSATRKN